MASYGIIWYHPLGAILDVGCVTRFEEHQSFQSPAFRPDARSKAWSLVVVDGFGDVEICLFGHVFTIFQHVLWDDLKWQVSELKPQMRYSVFHLTR